MDYIADCHDLDDLQYLKLAAQLLARRAVLLSHPITDPHCCELAIEFYTWLGEFERRFFDCRELTAGRPE